MGEPKPKRRWYQFSLRALLVFVLLVGSVVSYTHWLGVKLHQAKQQEAVEAIQNAGGKVAYKYEIVYSVELTGKYIRHTDTMTHIAVLTNLNCLNLWGTNVTDAGLEHIEGLTSLETLILGDTCVTDAGLEHIGGLTSLRTLDLHGTPVTDAGLSHLKRLTNLEEVDLSGTPVTDEGVKELRRALPNCWIVK